MPETFSEAVIDLDMETLYWEVSIPTFLDIFVLQMCKRAGTGCGFEGVLWWCQLVVDPLRGTNTKNCIDAERICKLVESEIWSWCSNAFLSREKMRALCFLRGLQCAEQATVEPRLGMSEQDRFHILWLLGVFWVKGRCTDSYPSTSVDRRLMVVGKTAVN